MTDLGKYWDTRELIRTGSGTYWDRDKRDILMSTRKISFLVPRVISVTREKVFATQEIERAMALEKHGYYPGY